MRDIWPARLHKSTSAQVREVTKIIRWVMESTDNPSPNYYSVDEVPNHWLIFG